MTKNILILSFIIIYIGSKENNNKIECPVIGIDLETTNSYASVYKNGKVEIILNDQGSNSIPSVVGLLEEELLVGRDAINKLDLTQIIYDFKRLIGRNFSDKEVQIDKKKLQYNIINKEGKPYIEAIFNNNKKQFSVEQISSMIFKKLKENAEAQLDHEIKNAVISVPAYFNDSQILAIKEAGEMAGLRIIRIINEPTAAAFAYGLDKLNKDLTILVYDLGDTLDVSILTIEDGVIEVILTSRDSYFGGRDFDQKILLYFLKLVKKKFNKDISNNKIAIQKLKREILIAKNTLSSTLEYKINIKNFLVGEDFCEVLTRAKFEELNNDLFKKF